MRKRIADETRVPLYMVYSNDAMNSVCELLPGNTSALLKVSGFGKVKVKQFGDEVIEIVTEYCAENNIDPQHSVKESRKKKDKEIKSPTVDETIALYKIGKKIDEIAKESTLAISTIEGHLAQAIGKQLIKIEEVMSLEEAKKIAKYFNGDSASYSLNAIKEKAPGVSYGKLRMVLAWIQLDKNK
jgi:ribonuclease D